MSISISISNSIEHMNGLTAKCTQVVHPFNLKLNLKLKLN